MDQINLVFRASYAKIAQVKFKAKACQPSYIRSNSFKFIYPLGLGGSNLKSNLNQVTSDGLKPEPGPSMPSSNLAQIYLPPKLLRIKFSSNLTRVDLLFSVFLLLRQFDVVVDLFAF